MKYRSDEIDKLFHPYLDVGRPYIFSFPKPDFSCVQNKELERALHQIRNVIGATIRASFQIKGIYDDTVVCHKMAASYPWRRNRITKSQHINFIWAHFTNACYLFEERYKLLMNHHHRTIKIFGMGKPTSVSEGIKTIRKELGHHIRQRGQNTHEWSTTNPHAQHFETIEFINSVERQIEGPLANVEGQFRVTRMIIRWEIESGIKFMESFLIELLSTVIPELAECALTFNQIVEGSQNQRVKIRGNEVIADVSK
jgi:hypothetical protein